MRVAVYSLPIALGNPYRTATLPNIHTLSAIFDPLTRIDRAGAVHPHLATGWTRRDDGDWELTLREGVRFSNGEPFDADTVVHAVEYLISEAGQVEGVTREASYLAGAEALSPHRVLLRVNRPVPDLPRYLTILFMVAPEQWNRLGRDGFAEQPVGTGPFALTEWRPGIGRFQAFQGSWRPPQMDALDVRELPDGAARAQAFHSGGLDIAIPVSIDEKAAVERGGGQFLAWEAALLRTINFVLTARPGPVHDARVRQALNMAIDRQTMIDVFLDGATSPATQPGVAGGYGYDPSLPSIPYDPERAKALLAETGYPNGFDFSIDVVIGANPGDAAIYQQLAAFLGAIGVRTEVRSIPTAKMFQSYFLGGRWEADAFGMVFSSEPFSDVLRGVDTNGCMRPNPWWCNAEIDALLQRARSHADPEQRLALRHELMARTLAEAPAILLWPEVRTAAVAGDIEGFEAVHGVISYDRIRRRPASR